MTGKLAIVFPGQGCQFVGMSADLCAAHPQALELFQRADEVLGFPLSGMCVEGPDEVLNDTANTQPAIYVASMALWALLAPTLTESASPVTFAAGHSLGEFSALTAAGAISFEDGVRLVRRRGEAMRDAGEAAPGGMVAIIGLDDDEVHALIEQVSAEVEGDGVWAANYNSPGQVIIAGTQAGLDRAMALAKERGAKRALPLQVSVACHTPLMAAAAEQLSAALNATTWSAPWAPVVANAVAEPLSDPQALQAALLRQLTSPVRWVESVQRMAQEGVTTILEVGPKSVLAGLIKRIDRTLTIEAVTDLASLQALDLSAL
jgi:[acyl-carrier-protein] S-malonyltransferase